LIGPWLWLNSGFPGLGGSVANCGRHHKSIAEVIRNQEDRAIIRIQLDNTGGNAYRAADYGGAIIIERQIFRSGRGNK
jgi:hypothetical protein